MATCICKFGGTITEEHNAYGDADFNVEEQAHYENADAKAHVQNGSIFVFFQHAFGLFGIASDGHRAVLINDGGRRFFFPLFPSVSSHDEIYHQNKKS